MQDSTNPSGSGNLSIMDAMQALEGPETPEKEQVEEESAELETDENQNQEPETEEEPEGESEEEGELDESDEDAEDQKEPELYTVKVDGEEIKVNLDELKAGYMQQASYTKQTQALAKERKAFAAEAQAVLAERQQYQQLLGALEQQLNVNQEPDWDTLRNEDPIEYSLQMADWQRKIQKQAAIRQEQEKLAQLHEIENQKQIKAMLLEQQKALESALPDWKDAEKRKTISSKVMEMGKKLGFKDEELNQVFDHRAILAIHKAALYDEMMSKRESLKPEPNSKVIAPKAKTQFGNVVVKRAREAFVSKPTISSAAQLLTLLEK